MGNPKVTVLMPVYNAEKYVGEAIESILNQTFRNFEFLIINDGSTDNSLGIIKSYKDLRIRLVNNEKNLGLSHTLNKGIELSEGEYIARMDADDISLPKRLEKQIEFMDAHPEVGICGAWMEVFDGKKTYGIATYPTTHENIKIRLFWSSAFSHPTVCLRKKVLLSNNLRYNAAFTPSEDYHLWHQMVEMTECNNLPSVFLRYRRSVNQMTRDQNIIDNADRLTRINMLNRIKLGLSEDEIKLHLTIFGQNWETNYRFWDTAISWLENLSFQNHNIRYFKANLFDSYLANFLWLKCCLYANKNFKTYHFYKNSILSQYHTPNYVDVGRIKIKQVIKYW